MNFEKKTRKQQRTRKEENYQQNDASAYGFGLCVVISFAFYLIAIVANM